MERQRKRQREGRKAKEAGHATRGPVAARERAKRVQESPRRNCYECVFCVSHLVLWARTLLSGFPVAGQCANHAETPGQWRPVSSKPCRNFRAKPLRVEPPKAPNDKIRYIPLTRGRHAIVDTEDYEWLSQYKWYATNPTPSGRVYAARGNSGAKMFMHRFIMQPPEGMVVDHINSNGLDNRICTCIAICITP